MISVTAYAGDVKVTTAATAANCKNPIIDFTIKPFQYVQIKCRLAHMRPDMTPRRRFQSANGPVAAIINDIAAPADSHLSPASVKLY
jgi:hypothetical protein